MTFDSSRTITPRALCETDYSKNAFAVSIRHRPSWIGLLVLLLISVACVPVSPSPTSESTTFSGPPSRPAAAEAVPSSERSSTLKPTSPGPIGEETPEATVTTPTVEASPRPEPTTTHESQPTETEEPIGQGTVLEEGEKVSVVMVFQDARGILLLGPDGGLIGEIPMHPIGVTWSADGCQLQATIAIGEDTRLYTIDLQGNILRETFFAGGYDSSGGWRTWPALSPNGHWISYVVWSGDMFYSGAEYQDIQVVTVENQGEPLRLTEHGGAWERGAVWSPDGEFLAFSDLDETGVAQLLTWQTGSNAQQQLTRFTRPNLRIGAIAWSADGGLLAFGTYYGDGLGGLWVISQDGKGLRPMNFDETSPLDSDWLMWSHDGSILVAATRGYVPADGLYWFEVSTGEVYHSHHPAHSIAFPFRIYGTESVGYLGGDRILYRYDLEDGALSQWADCDLLSRSGVQQIISPPKGPVDITLCP